MKFGCIFIGLMALLLSSPASAQDPVSFPDANLKAIVEDALWISDPTPADMLGLINLIGSNRNVASLEGLETATSLEDLTMSYNQISDISMLSGLSNLTILALSNNQISDISPLSGLHKLRHLDVHDNDIADITPLAGLSRLETLFIRYNDISDISVLAGLKSLRHLDIHGNHSSDLSALADLSSLEQLHLQFNQISDISPLAGLSKLRILRLRRNEISDISALTGLKNLDLLDLEWNYQLNDNAYCSDLDTIYHNNPGIDLIYSPQSRAPTGLYASYGSYVDRIEITWDKICNGPLYTSYYRVYRAPSADGGKTAVSPWQTARRYYDMTAEPRQSYYYWVQMSLDPRGSDASEFSGPEEGKISSQPALHLSSSAGGFVTVPGEGVHVFPIGVPPVRIQAEPTDGVLFRFAGWTGTAVDAGLVSDRSKAHTTAVVNDNYQLRANFESNQSILYVDDDALGDPAPGDSSLSDPEENGTAMHPFDRIQEAIEVAAEGVSIVVAPGQYYESIDSLGKGFQLIGLDPNGADFPVIHGDNTGPVVYFRDNQDPNCHMTGFVITQGQAHPASAIHCRNSNPSFSHCLIVGNRYTEQAGDAILCSDSNAVFTHCTIAHNLGGIRLVNSQVILTNSIVWENSPSEILWDETSELNTYYTAIAGAWPGLGNIDSDPLFVAPGLWQALSGTSERQWIEGDYHPMSRAGRWDPEERLWLQDALHSPCIDGGDPSSPLGFETGPHGGRVNMGAYGGTAQASRSR